MGVNTLFIIFFFTAIVKYLQDFLKPGFQAEVDKFIGASYLCDNWAKAEADMIVYQDGEIELRVK